MNQLNELSPTARKFFATWLASVALLLSGIAWADEIECFAVCSIHRDGKLTENIDMRRVGSPKNGSTPSSMMRSLMKSCEILERSAEPGSLAVFDGRVEDCRPLKPDTNGKK